MFGLTDHTKQIRTLEHKKFAYTTAQLLHAVQFQFNYFRLSTLSPVITINMRFLCVSFRHIKSIRISSHLPDWLLYFMNAIQLTNSTMNYYIQDTAMNSVIAIVYVCAIVRKHRS